MYVPQHNQLDPDNPLCTEDSAYPANPDSEYGWEKLFSERPYLTYARNYKLNCKVARYHNIFGLKAHGMVAEKKHQQHYVEKLQNLMMVVK